MVVEGADSGRPAARSRIWTGLIALALGCFLAGDSVHRARLALDAVATWWPWALLALAAFNVLRSVVPVNSLIGPSALVVAALSGLALSHGLDARDVRDLGVPLALAGYGAVVLLSAGRTVGRTRWTRFLSTGHVHVPAGSGELLVFRALLGELRADLATDPVGGPEAVHVTAVAGHVRITVPHTWQVRVHASGAPLTRISETSRRETSVPPGADGHGFATRHEVALHLLGVCSAVSIVYA
ncbi:hypothetical protein AB0I51_14970 [Streptomyces sp. NPDC050549]|uniref:hypothetical protein n=1 Tax=Streptomyces sp. NPDC050549 TaxID=3155406 RepID=UPI00341E7344